MGNRKRVLDRVKEDPIGESKKKTWIQRLLQRILNPYRIIYRFPKIIDSAIKYLDAEYRRAFLIRAIMDMQEDTVKRILDNGVSPDSKSDGMTALNAAVSFGNEQIVKMLLERGASINLAGTHNFTPLLTAAARNKANKVRLLLEMGANINARDNRGLSPLLMAIWHGYADIAEMLIKKGARVNVADRDGTSALLYAMQSKQERLLRLLLENGLDLNNKINQSERALAVGAAKGYRKLAKILIDHGMDVDFTGKAVSAIFILIRAMDLDALKFLLDLGADVNNDSNDARMSPLILAAIMGHLEMVQLLVERGANVNHTSTDPETPLTSACKGISNERYALVRFLLEKEADLHFKDHRGATALFGAVQTGCPKTIKLLVENGAEVNDKDAKGTYLLEYAIRSKNAEIAGLLLELGADADPEKDCRLLKVASIVGTSEIVEVLRSYGALYPEELKCTRMEDEKLISALQSASFDEAVNRLNMLVENEQKEFNAKIVLRVAAERGEIEVLKKILLDFPDLDVQEALDSAASADNEDVFELLFEKKRYTEKKAIALSLEPELGSAARNGSSKIFDLLLNQCDKLRVAPELGESLLLTAGSYGHFNIAEKLLDLGFGIIDGQLTSAGMKILRYAIIEKKTDLAADLLRRAGLNDEEYTIFEAPMLTILCERNELQLSRSMIKAGSDPNVQNKKGMTPLMRASELGHPEIVELLLFQGADPNIRDEKGQTALDYAFQRKRGEIVEQLRKSGAKG